MAGAGFCYTLNMSKRTYHQYCPLAYGLDVIGERWTLLVVRELLYGPRRYTDILNGLPGIGTNLLAKRLRDLEQAGIVRQRTLPPPASSTVYELTEHGHGLEEAIRALARWGAVYRRVPPPQEDFMGPVPAMHAFTMLFNPAAAAGLDVTCEVHAGMDVFFVAVRDGVLDVRPGPAQQPDIVISGEPKSIVQAMAGPSPNGGITLEAGDEAALGRFVSAFVFSAS